MSVVRIGIMSAGSMGAGVGARIAQNPGFKVYTVVEGRSQATRDRAISSGFTLSPSLSSLLSNTDILLSILPPGDAVPFARSVISVIASRDDRGEGFTFADCNAVSPGTAREIADIFRENGLKTSYVDGSIAGGPPKEGYSPVFYFSGEGDAAAKLDEKMKGSGITVKTLEGGIGAASALKMAYASTTKGLLGLVALAEQGAHASSILPSLLSELQSSNPHAFSKIPGLATTLPTKSYRWVAEMREIGAFYTEAGLPEGGEVFEGLAKLFERMDREKGEGERAGDVLREARDLVDGMEKQKEKESK